MVSVVVLMVVLGALKMKELKIQDQITELSRTLQLLLISDVKRDQKLEAETEAEAKDKVMNKKYQMMIDSIQVNLYHYDQNDTV